MMNRSILRSFGAFCLFLMASTFALAGELVPALAILHTNDVHGRFAESKESLGHDRIAAIYRQTRERIPATMLLDAGDAIQGMPLVKWNKGEAAIRIMNLVGYDGMALGNHEFDYGWERLLALLELSEFPFLTQPVVSEGKKGFEAAAIYERGGRRIGVFGLTTPETKQSSGGGFNKDFGTGEDTVAYAEAMVYSLRNAGAEVVVCLAHLGSEEQGFLTSYGLRDRVDGIDLVIDGHSHTPLAEIEQVAGKALVVSSGEYAGALGLVEFYPDGARLRPVARSIGKKEAADVEPVPAITRAIAEWGALTEARGSRVVAFTPVFLNANRDVVRTREAEIGNAMADSMREATGAAVALVNGGSIRASLQAGDLTANDIESVLPYDTVVLTADVRGGAIREALELSVSSYPDNAGGFLQVSGLAFAFDPKKPAGRRVTKIEVGGKALDDDQIYSLSVTDWMAMGGDGYEMLVKPFSEASDAKVVTLIDVFIDHLGRNRDNPPVTEGRIVNLQ